MNIHHVGDPDVAGKHLGDLYLKIEQPPKWTTKSEGKCSYTHYMWTDDRDRHKRIIRPATDYDDDCDSDFPDDSKPTRYLWIDRTMLHEYGHTLGLKDYYDDASMDELDAMMNTNLDITDEDIEQLRAIYFLHTAHSD